MPSNIIIIGAGLTGLTAAYFLQKENIPVQIIEARDRLGGRIHTLRSKGCTPIEMGATWLGKKHHHLTKLLQELKIGTFEQVLGERAIYEPISTSPPQIVQLPPNSDPSFRIRGGTDMIIQALMKRLKNTPIHTGQVVQSIQQTSEGLEVHTRNKRFKANIIISTLPSFLFTETIKVQPALPTDLLQIARRTHTWMGESIKIALTYAHPFWRNPTTSGTIFSNVGPIPEMYDHSNYEDNLFALKGFLNGAYHSVSKSARQDLVIGQLQKYFGKQVYNFLNYEESVWQKDPFTYAPYPAHVLPHQHNGHAIFRRPYLNGCLFIAGSETAASFPGYMDGAVESAGFVCGEVLKLTGGI